MTRVMLVDDHELLAHSLCAALGPHGFDVVVPSVLTDTAVLDHAESLRPDVVLLDLHLDDDERTAVGLIAPMCALGATVVVVTAETDPLVLATCIEAGAAGWVNKSEPFDRLVEAVREVAAGGVLVGVSRRGEMLAELQRHRADLAAVLEPFQLLTAAEGQVLAALVAGRSAEAIAQARVVATSTVRSQIRSILAKLGVSSQLAAAAMAREAGWAL